MKRTAHDGDGHEWLVFLDGVLLRNCTEADDVEGYALVWELGPVEHEPPEADGEFGSFRAESQRRLTGKVEFKRA